MSGAALLAGISLLLWIAPGGIIAAFCGRRTDRLWADDMVAVAITTGLGVLTIGSSVLALLGLLTFASVWSVGVTLTGSAIVLSIACRGAGKHTPKAPNGKEIALILLPVGIALLAALPLLHSILARPDSLPGSTPWYYWDLAAQTAKANGFPVVSFEWGTQVPFLRDYPGFTAGTAGVALASTRPDLLFAGHIFRILAAVGTGLGVWYLSRAWGANRYASTASVFLLLATSIFAIKLLSYRPESAGYALMLIVPAMGKRWLDTRRPIFRTCAAIGLVALGLIHGVTWTFGAVLLVATAIAWTVLTKRSWRQRLAVAGSLILITFGTWAATSLMISGRLTEVGKLATAPEISETGEDPTWTFATLVRGSDESTPPSILELGQGALTRGFLGLHPWSFWLFGVLAALILFGKATRRDHLSRELLLMLGLFTVGIAIIAATFILGWDTYVPRRTGALRILQLSVVVVPFAIATGASRLAPLSWLSVGSLAVAFSVGIWAFVAGGVADLAHTQLPVHSSLTAQRALDLDGVALANGYTEGYLASNLGIHGLLEGRAPYTNAKLLESTNNALFEARSFFADPLNESFDIVGYDLVIVMTDDWVMGTSNIIPADIEAFLADPRLRLVAEGDSWFIFERS